MFLSRRHALVAVVLLAANCPAFADDPNAKLPASVPMARAGATKLEVKNVIGLVGQTITLEAALSRADGGAPVAGRAVTFRIKGTPGGDVAAGNGSTDGTGRAKVSFKVPEIKQGSYELAAVSPGETPTAGAATGAAKIGIFKAETKLTLDETTPAGGGTVTETRRCAPTSGFESP